MAFEYKITESRGEQGWGTTTVCVDDDGYVTLELETSYAGSPEGYAAIAFEHTEVPALADALLRALEFAKKG